MNANRLSSAFYQLARSIGAPFRYRVSGLENVRDTDPAIYIANHLGSIGPVQAILAMPVRFYPWVIGEMLDPQRAGSYLYDDFVHPTWGLSGRTGSAVSTVVSRFAVGLLRALGCISMDSNRGRYVDAFRRSLTLLADGQNLLIFPEDPHQSADPDTGLRPFYCGFIGLCYMHERATGHRLPIYPLAVHAGAKTLAVGEAHFYEPRDGRRADVARTCRELQRAVRGLYQELSNYLP